MLEAMKYGACSLVAATDEFKHVGYAYLPRCCCSTRSKLAACPAEPALPMILSLPANDPQPACSPDSRSAIMPLALPVGGYTFASCRQLPVCSHQSRLAVSSEGF